MQNNEVLANYDVTSSIPFHWKVLEHMPASKISFELWIYSIIRELVFQVNASGRLKME